MKSFKKSLSIVLAVLMLFSTLVVGTLTSNAATETTVYLCPSQISGFSSYVDSSTGEIMSDYTLKLNTNHKGDGDAWHQYDMALLEETIGGKAVYSYTFTDTYSGLGCIQFQIYQGSTHKTQIQPFGTKEWTQPTVYNNKLYNGSSWVTPTWDVTESSEATSASTGATSESTQTTTASTEATQPTTQPTSEPVEKTKVYFVNSGKWTVVNAYVWTGSNNNAWPGDAMTATGEKAGNGADIYSYEFDSKYTNIIFTNKNTGSIETDTLTPENGKYYDYNTNKWYDDPAEIAATGDVVTLAGTMNGWSTSKTPFVDGSVSVDLDAETTYEFKIVINGSWHGKGGTMTSDNCTGWTFKSEDGSNCKITTTIAGTYTFNFDSSTKKLSVVYPEPAETDYTVVFNYVTEDGTQTLTKTTTSAESDVTKVATSVMPNIENKMYSYALGECTADGTTITANLVETKKLYSVTVDGAIMETQFGYKDKATVTLKDGTEYTFYVTGDIEITSDDPKVAAALSLDAVTVTDTKVSMDLLATANVDKFARMGVAFANAEKTVDEIAAAVANVTTGTAVSNGIAVHNSKVDKPNESGSYQFTYAPYVSKDKANKTLYFYTFAVDTDGNVSVSSVVSVDLANAVA